MGNIIVSLATFAGFKLFFFTLNLFLFVWFFRVFASFLFETNLIPQRISHILRTVWLIRVHSVIGKRSSNRLLAFELIRLELPALCLITCCWFLCKSSLNEITQPPHTEARTWRQHWTQQLSVSYLAPAAFIILLVYNDNQLDLATILLVSNANQLVSWIHESLQDIGSCT